MKKFILGGLAAAAVIAPIALTAGSANAADGAQLIIGGDFSSPTIGGLLNVSGATTDFSLTSSLAQANNGPAGSMWDPGTYVVGTNPNAFHASGWTGRSDSRPDADRQRVHQA